MRNYRDHHSKSTSDNESFCALDWMEIMNRLYGMIIVAVLCVCAITTAEPLVFELEAMSTFKAMNGGTFGQFTVIETTTACSRCGTSDYALKIPFDKADDGSWSSEQLSDPMDIGVYVGFWVNFGSDGADPNLADCQYELMEVSPVSGDWDIALTVQDTGTCDGTNHKLCIRDADNVLVDCTIDNIFVDDVWYWIDVVWMQDDVGGWILLYVTRHDAVARSTLLFVDSMNDFKTATAGARRVRFRSQKTESGGSVIFHIRGVLIMENMDLIGAQKPHWGMYTTEINPYKNSITPDCSATGVGGGGQDLDDGNWDDIGDDLISSAQYAGLDGGAIAADDNTMHGLLGPFTTDDWITPVLGCRFGYRGGGVRGDGDIEMVWGKWDGNVTWTVDKVEPPGCAQICNFTKQVLPGDAYFPEGSNYAVMGFRNKHPFTAVTLREARCWYFTAYPKSRLGIWDRPNANTVARGSNRGGG